MSSSTVKAQRLANEANLQITDKTNAANREIAESQNALNYKMFNEQNQWNLEQWNRENEYNSPAAQMQRYIMAGINPVWALGNGDPGNAQQLTSAQHDPAVGAHMDRAEVQPEYDPSRLSAIVGAAQNVSNTIQGFLKLGLEQQEVETHRRSQASQASVNSANAALARARAAGQNVENQWNISNFGIRSQTAAQTLLNLRKQYEQMDANTEVARTKLDEIRANTDLIRENINSVREQVSQRWKQLEVDWFNAKTSRQSVLFQGESLDVQRQSLELDKQRFSLDVRKIENDIRNQDNRLILDFVSRFGEKLEGTISGAAGSKALGLEVSGSASASHVTPADVQRMQACGIVLGERASLDPSPANVKAYDDYLKVADRAFSEMEAIGSISERSFEFPGSTPVSILNQ